MTNTLTRMESFPFDSRFDGYDANGYPVYDRAVGADILRMVFRQFFSDGVFQREADDFYIEPASTGLAVVVKRGAAIIQGAMGGLKEDAVLTLDTAPPVGRTPYAIMARLDDNSEFRSLYLRVVSSTAGEAAVPASPETTAAVRELRLGYVILPSGATDMSDAEIVNEKGTALCPYAAPFVDIDLSMVVAQAAESANVALDDLAAVIERKMGLIQSALDKTTAGYLQNQIDALTLAVADAGTPDNVTLAKTEDGILYVKDGGISAAKFDPSAEARIGEIANEQIDISFRAVANGTY